ncbi:MAG: phosphotransferase, partial [Roseovarius sp.]
IDPGLLAAFFDGYDLVGADDPSVGYLLRVRILMDWAAIPARMLDRSKGQGRRLKRLQRLAERALA